jgi:hypothetical protein
MYSRSRTWKLYHDLNDNNVYLSIGSSTYLGRSINLQKFGHRFYVTVSWCNIMSGIQKISRGHAAAGLLGGGGRMPESRKRGTTGTCKNGRNRAVAHKKVSKGCYCYLWRYPHGNKQWGLIFRHFVEGSRRLGDCPQQRQLHTEALGRT